LSGVVHATRAVLFLPVLLAASCGHLDDGYTKEIPPAAGVEGSDLDARARVSGDQRSIQITATGGACDESAEVRVSETARKVVIVLRVASNDGPCTSEAIGRSFPVDLQQPLGDRALVGGNGHAYPRLEGRPDKTAQLDIPVRISRDG
jgi:hypothetical protein